MPGALFWFAPLQREGMRSPGRKVGASAVGTGPLPSHNPAGPFELGVVYFAIQLIHVNAALQYICQL